MKCEKCGNEITEEDIFCQNCGCKIEREEQIESNKNINEKEIETISNSDDLNLHKKKSKKSVFIISFIIVILLAIIGFSMFSIPKDVEIEAGTLANEIYNGDVDKYASNNLFVHGYIIRDTRESNNEKNGYYIVVSDIDNWETLDSSQIVTFKYDMGIEESVGTGSEIIVQGHLDIQEDSPDMSILVGDDITIKNKVDPTYKIDFDQLSNDYVNKKITITGRMINVIGDGNYLTDVDLNYAVKLKGFTEDEFASYFKNGSYAVVTGVLKDTGVIDVEKIDQNQTTKDMSFEYGTSVKDCINSYVNIGEEITIKGIFVKNGSFSVPYSVQDEETGQFIALSVPFENIDLDKYFESGENCVVTGYISEGGTSYVINITAIG